MATITLIPATRFLSKVLPPGSYSDLDKAFSFIKIVHLDSGVEEEEEEDTSDESTFSLDEDGLTFIENWAIDVDGNLEIDFPFLPGAKLIFGRPPILKPIFITEIRYVDDNISIKFKDITTTLRIPPKYLQTYEDEKDEENKWKKSAEIDGYDLQFNAGFGIDQQKGLIIEGEFAKFEPFMIADTGVIIDLKKAIPIFDNVPGDLADVLDSDFKGIYISEATIVYFKPGNKFDPTITLRDAAIGSGGFSGEVFIGEAPNEEGDTEIEFDEELLTNLFNENEPNPTRTPDGSVDDIGLPRTVYPVKFLGMKAVLEYFGIGFKQSIPEWGTAQGYIFMPFAEKWARLRATIGGPDGNFMLEIGGVGDEGLINLENELFKITVDSIAYVNKPDSQGVNTNYAIVSGGIRLKQPAGLNMPEFKADKISISEKGDIQIEGGWIKAPEAITLDLGGFKVSIREIGLGNETKNEIEHQWVGFSGDVQLVEGLPIKGSVEGLKVSWPKDGSGGAEVSLKGIGIDFTIPGTLSFSGSVKYDDKTNLFKGHVKVNLICLRTEIEGQLMVGKFRDANGNEFGVFYIALLANLPAAIPLAATGLGLYGLRGLVGINVAPGKEEKESWYDWYKNGNDDATKYTVHPVEKWVPMMDNYAFGAGVLIGTQYDDGTTINLSAMLVVLIPGPVIMLEGKANLLKPRSGDTKEEGAFYLLAVLDGRAGTFQLNIDVKYSLADIVTVGGNLEAFFDFNNAENWHIWIGQKEPESKRIRADILKVFSADMYFMIDSKLLQFGASSGLKLKETLGPAELRLVIQQSFNATIFFKPFQLEGDAKFLMDVGVSVFGIGLGLYLEAFLSLQTPDPFIIEGSAIVRITLFWPFSPIEGKLSFKWEEGPELTPAEKPLLKDANPVAGNFTKMAVMQHHKSNEFKQNLWVGMPPQDDIRYIPVVPVDSRPALTFAKRLHKIGNEVVHSEPDIVGNGLFIYELTNLVLEESIDCITFTTIRKGFVQTEEKNAAGAPMPFFKINHTEDAQSGDGFFLNGKDAQEPVLELWKYGVWDRANLYERQTKPLDTPPCGSRSEGKNLSLNWFYEPLQQLPTEFWYRGVYFISDRVPVASDQSGIMDYRYPVVLHLDNVPPLFGNTTSDRVGLLRCQQQLTMVLPELCVSAMIVIYVRKTINPGDLSPLPARTTEEAWYKKEIDAFNISKEDDGERGDEDDVNALEVKAWKSGVEVGGVTRLSEDTLVVYKIEPGGGFDTLQISELTSEDKAFFVYMVNFKTAPVQTTVNPSNQNTDGNDTTLNNGYVRKETLLKPNHFYRLTVETNITGHGGGPALDHLYFRTDSGPGLTSDPLSEPNKKVYLPYADSPDNENVGSPVNDFAAYVAGTFPIHGALAHYPEEDIVIGFNESYLLGIYQKADGKSSLKLRIKDRNELTVPVGEPARILMKKLSADPGLMTWLGGMQEGGCGGVPAQHQYGLAVAASGMSANNLYFAELYDDRFGDILFEFQFTTSRYLSFREHLIAIGERLPDSSFHATAFIKTDTAAPKRTVGVLNANLVDLESRAKTVTDATKVYRTLKSEYENKIKDAATSHLEMVSGYEEIIKNQAEWSRIGSELFQEIDEIVTPCFLMDVLHPDGTSVKVNMIERGLPERPEIIQVPFLTGGNQYLLLWESPEPLDWINMVGGVYTKGLSSPVRNELFFIPNADGTRAFLLFNESLLFKSNRYGLNMEWLPFEAFASKIELDAATQDNRNATILLQVGTDVFRASIGLGGTLSPGSTLTSTSSLHTFTFTPEGNLQLFNSNRLVWESRTANLGARRLEMAANGNLAIMGDTHQILWESGTGGAAFAGSQLYLQDDGNLALRNAANKVVWETATRNGHVPRERLLPGESLLPGQSLWSNNRQYRLTYQTEGNLAFYRLRDQQLLWSSGTTPPNPGRASMEKSGDIVIYSGDNLPIWRTNLNVQSPIVHNRLEIADTGLVQIMRYDGVPVDSLDKTPATAVSDIRFTAFKHTVSGASSNNWTAKESILDHAALNGQPNAKVFIMADWGPASGGLSNDHPLFVEYGNGRWRIVNGDGGAMSAGYHFNVLVVPEHCPHAFVHEAAWNTLQQNRTYLDHPACNGKPDARLLVTAASKDNRMRPIGVSYDQLRSRWFIFNAVQSANEANDRENHGIAQGSRFHVLALNAENAYNMEAFVHQASADNIIPAGSHLSFMDYPGINTNTSALIFVTHLWEGGDMKTINPAMSMLWYDAPNDSWRYKDGYWSVINTGIPVRPMYDGVKFQVMVFKPQPSGS